MTNFTLAGITFTNLSTKWTMAILGASLLVFTGLSMFSRNRAQNNRLLTTTILRSSPTVPQSSSESVPEIPANLINNAPELPNMLNDNPVQEEPLANFIVEERAVSDVFFIIKSGDEEEQRFDNWDEAKAHLDGFRNTLEPDLMLKFEFPRDRILKHRTEAQFRGWLARVSDYVLAQRILLSHDLSQVLRRNPSLMRPTAAHVDKFGCALFLPADDTWQMSIRGLEHYSEELAVLGGEIARALREPSLMALCEPLAVKKISDILAEMGEKLPKNQVWLSDNFIDKCTWSTDTTKFFNNADRKNLGVENNIGAYLPLLDLSNLPGINEHESDIRKLSEEFFSEFYSKVVISTIKTAQANTTNLDKVTNAHMDWLFRRLKLWTKDSNISSLFLRSLFVR